MILVIIHEGQFPSAAQAQAAIELIKGVPSLSFLPVAVIRAVEASPKVCVTGSGIVPFEGTNGHNIVMELADKLSVLGGIFYAATIRLVMSDGTHHTTVVPSNPRKSS